MSKAQSPKNQRAIISVRGVVQGVGFRPFVYRLAAQRNLCGWVRNTTGNVEIEVEGNRAEVRSFLKELASQIPPMAHIEQIRTDFAEPIGYADFRIQDSLAQKNKYQLVSPDIATCPDCRNEIFNPDDRRFRYPFTNCTNCGPRFTIIEDVPYDRSKTTMREFKMCPRCEQEYHDPLDRRFHAQPNACPECGPKLELVDSTGKSVKCTDVIRKAGDLLKNGKILAIRGLGGFQLACDATNQIAVNLLRRRKYRPDKPFAVMDMTIEDVKKYCRVSVDEIKLLESPQNPIVLLRWDSQTSNIAQAVAPDLKYLGMMLPYTPLHHLLLREVGLPLVMTSGNLSEEPIAKDNEEAFIRLKGIADYFLLHNRGIYARYDDSVFMVEEKKPVAVRRARGYAPYPIHLPFKAKQILACGAELKNTFCLTRDDNAFVSQHIGDMENEETLEHYENTIELYKRLFRIEPEIVACDMHPEYLPSKYALRTAREQKLKLVPVQHHHAHIVSCMIENGINTPVIGVAFDGVGYGTDGAIWGGEFLVADWKNFWRAGQFEYVPMPGGATAIKKPYRMALGYLYSLLGDDFSLEGLPPAKLNPVEIDIIRQQVKKRVNCPLTSSAGRLFDAVAALTGFTCEASYEAQAAIALEMQATDKIMRRKIDTYPFSFSEESGVKIVKLGELCAAVVEDIRNHVTVSVISLKLHRTVAKVVFDMCKIISADTGIKQVALSGGVFQNRLLLNLTTAGFRKAGFDIFTHHLVPCNDGGLSLGQVVIANFKKD
ncbi:MAG: carbamoyltransferase HypF [Dehalococcoidales bacterium]|nr:carbamoyltransferase HypF [Dehalococcoidales bacterium]